MTALNFNPTPKAVFQADSKRMRLHLGLLESPQLSDSLSVAMLEYQRRLAKASDLNEAAAAHFKMVGVVDFIDVFLKLAEQTAPAKVKVEGQLLPTT